MPATDFADKGNIAGEVYKNYQFESVAEVTNALGKWYIDKDGYCYWEGGVETFTTLLPAKNKETEPGFWKSHFGLDILNGELESQLKEMKVGILDTGIDDTHPDLVNVVNSKFNTVGSKTLMDNDGHGTHCAGILAGSGGNRVKGVAAGVRLNVCKIMTLTSGGFTGLNSSVFIKALREIGGQSSVISISAGIPDYDPVLHQIIQQLAEKGVVIVAAIGNTQNGQWIPQYPALFEECISVGALSGDLELSDYTVRHSRIDICVPGENIISSLPVSKGSYGAKSGTSMATPFVAGIVALIKAKFPNYTYKEVRQLLFQFSDLRQKDNFYYRSIKNEKISL